MATTTEDRHGTSEERPAGAPPAPRRRSRKGFAETVRDMYIERRDGPVTMAERRRGALVALISIPVFAAVVVGIQTGIRGREVETSWYVAMGVATAVFTAIAFAFPRFSPSGWAHIHSTDWSKESTGSKVVGIVAMLGLVAFFVARAIWRMDG